MSEPDNRKTLSHPQHKQHLPNGHQARYTAETVLRTRPKTYRKAVQLLADPNWSVLQISKSLRVSEHTVRAIRAREAQDIAERKKTLAAMLANVAELGAGRMEETVGKVGCRDAAFMTGIATSRTATRHTACLSLETKTIGWLNFSTLKPADFSKRPSAFRMEASSSRSQIGLQPSTREGEARTPDSSRCFNEESKSGI